MIDGFKVINLRKGSTKIRDQAFQLVTGGGVKHIFELKTEVSIKIGNTLRKIKMHLNTLTIKYIFHGIASVQGRYI